MNASIARSCVAAVFVVAGCSGAPETVGEEGSSVEACEVPPMPELYPGPLPPNPWDQQPEAGACIAQKHDVLIILGCQSKDDGTPADCQIARADMAVELAELGYGDRFIVSGGAVYNDHNEAETLADLLVERGIDREDVFLEPLAEHTDENIYFSSRIMQAQGFRSALVVSESAGHIVYTALCDSNCCVDLGRLTVVDIEGWVLGHYVLYPDAEPVTDAECDHIEDARMGLCVNLGNRRACKDHFDL